MARADYPVLDGNGATILPAGRGEASVLAELQSTNFQILYSLDANMNTTADQPMVRRHNFAAYCLQNVRVILLSGPSLTTCVGGIYTAAAKGGIPVVAASQVYSGLTTVGYGINATLGAGAPFGRQTADLIFSLSTPQGAAAVAGIYMVGFPVS